MTTSEPDKAEIIEKALHALFSIDELAGKIALHGGQALIAYGISHRASQDIDLYVKENTITDRQIKLIEDALTEEFNDSVMEVRKFKVVCFPSRTEPKSQTRINASIAMQSDSPKINMKSPVIHFGDSKGLDIEISLNSNMFHLSKVDSQDVIITVSSLTRIIYEKVLSSCENSPSYLKTHPGKGNVKRTLRTKDMFDISSIIRAKTHMQAQLMNADEIDFLKTLMENIAVVKDDLTCFRNDVTMYETWYREEYEEVNETLVPVMERIDFADAKNIVLQLLTEILEEL